MNVQEVVDLMIEYGFNREQTYYNYMDGDLFKVSIFDKERAIEISCVPTKEFEDYESKIPVGGKICYDLKQHIATLVCVFGPICTEANYLTGENEGIILSANAGQNSYYTHKLTKKNLVSAVCAQRNPAKHLAKILGCHLKNIRTVSKNLIPVLQKYDFKETFNSILCRGEKDETSNIWSTYEHKNCLEKTIQVTTDCFNGRLSVYPFEDVDFKKVGLEEFDKMFVERILKLDGTVRNCFEYLFDDDEKHTIDSYANVMACKYVLDENRIGADCANFKNVDVEKIPEKYMDLYKKACETIKK